MKLEQSDAAQSSPTVHGAVAIVGLGGCFPDAETVGEFWDNICRGHVAIGDVPEGRWNAPLYYSTDRSAPERTYSRIGGYIRRFSFDPRRFRIPPRSLACIDDLQKMALSCVAEALESAKLEVFAGDGSGRPFHRDRTAVILGNSMGGEAEDLTSLRVWLTGVEDAIRHSAAEQNLNPQQCDALIRGMRLQYDAALPPVTEDSMPGELSNCITGRVANAFDLHGPNFTTDAACAASIAAIQTAIYGLRAGDFDMAIAGGADRSMDPPTYVKFSKIGALSSECSAPFDARASGFVMGEGVGILLLKRLEDAQRDHDTIFAVIRGVGAASDGRGKGITAPNPRGQRLALQRAYAAAGVPIRSVGLFEAHGTSTPIGDTVELSVLSGLLAEEGGPPQRVPIGSVKSMIGHLKSASGAASLIKMALALHHKVLPPSANFQTPEATSPLGEGYLMVNTQTRPWQHPASVEGAPRRAGVSAFGFGGTNFHVVLEEYVPGHSPYVQKNPAMHSNREQGGVTQSVSASDLASASGLAPDCAPGPASDSGSAAYSGPAATATPVSECTETIIGFFAEATGYARQDLLPAYHLEDDLGIDTVKQAEVLALIRRHYALPEDADFRLTAMPTLQSIIDYVTGFGGVMDAAEGDAARSGAGDCVSGPQILVYGASNVACAVAAAQSSLRAAAALTGAVLAGRTKAGQAQTRLAFVADDLAMAQAKAELAAKKGARMLAAQGIFLAEGQALATTGKIAFLFPGQGSQYLGMLQDLAAAYPIVAATFAEADRVLEPLVGHKLTPIVWATQSEDHDTRLRETQNCQPAMLTADVAMWRLLAAHGVAPQMVAGHSLGEYAAAVAAGVLSFADALYAVSARGREMANVQVDDVGKMAMVAADAPQVEAILAGVAGYVIAANKNCHTQTVIAGNSTVVQQAITRFAEAGFEAREIAVSHAFHSSIVAPAAAPLAQVLGNLDVRAPRIALSSNATAGYYPQGRADIIGLMARQLASPVQFIDQVERLYADGARIFVEVGPRRAITGFVRNILGTRPYRAIAANHPKKSGVHGFLELLAALAADGVPLHFSGDAEELFTGAAAPGAAATCTPVTVAASAATTAADSTAIPSTGSTTVSAANSTAILTAVTLAEPLVISGMAVALPQDRPTGSLKEDLFGPLLAGQNYIAPLHDEERQKILDKNVTRLNKATGVFSPLQEMAEVIQLAARLGQVDLAEYGIDAALAEALDDTGRLAIATGIDALRDAGLPLMQRLRVTSTGTHLHDRWALPSPLAARTGVILASAFTGLSSIIEEVSRQAALEGQYRGIKAQEAFIDSWAKTLHDPAEATRLRTAFSAQLASARDALSLYQFNRKWLFRALSLGHAQLAQAIFAQGPNTQMNAACASGPQAMGIAEDWLRQGRCDRVVVVTADNATHPASLPWLGAAFLAAGAASVEARLEEAAVPFGAQRNGMILGAGAAAFVVERHSSVTARGMLPIAELLHTHLGNSAFHGTRMDIGYTQEFMHAAVCAACEKAGLSKEAFAQCSFFMSHETYTPARGGSSAAEVAALRHTFGAELPKMLVANTKGRTGHPMGGSIEDAVAIKGLQRQTLPGIANLNQVDPAFADLQFAKGGSIDRQYAVRFGAGFGSQVAVAIYRRMATTEGRMAAPKTYAAWLVEQGAPQGAGLEIVGRTLRVARSGGCAVTELGVPALCSPIAYPGVEANKANFEADRLSDNHHDAVLARLTAMFAEETGYDLKDLEPTHALEADLGIDTVKQAEVFAKVRAAYGMSAVAEFKLADVQTLEALTAYVLQQINPNGRPEKQTNAPDTAPDSSAMHASLPQDELPAAAAEPVTKAAPTPQSMPQSVSQTASPLLPPRAHIINQLIEQFAASTGYDVADLHPSHSLEADLGIDTVKQAEIFSAMRATYGLAADTAFRLSEVQTLEGMADYILAQLAVMPVKTPAVVSASFAATSAGSAATLAGSAVMSAASKVVPASVEPARPAELALGAVLARVTELFAEHTGYDPVDLAPNHQLEADLGVDTVKQAEVFGLIRQQYGLPPDATFKLHDVQTLTAIASYVCAQSSAKAAPDVPAVPTATRAALDAASAVPAAPVDVALHAAHARRDDDVPNGQFVARQVRLQRVTVPVASADRSSFVRRRIVLAGGDPGARHAMRQALIAHQAEVHVLEAPSRAPGLARAQAYEARLRQVGGPPPDMLIYLAADTQKLEWVHAPAAELFVLTRFWAQACGDAPKGGLLVVGQGGGGFGFAAEATSTSDGHASRTAMTQGFNVQGAVLAALSGIVKSLAKEWPQARCLALDVAVAEPWEQAAERALAAWSGWSRSAEAAAELVYRDGQWWVPQRQVDAIVPTGAALGARSLVVATGGARGVTFGLLQALARRRPFELIILGRTAGVEPSRSPLSGHDEATQKDVARAALTAAHKRATPAALRGWIEREMGRVEIYRNLEALRAAGCKVEFMACDVGDPAALSRAINHIKANRGTVDLLLHGAGVEESKYLIDKDTAAFTRVFNPKAEALLRLWTGLRPHRTVTMGSVSGRFGNAGQVDYAAANELMAGLARAPQHRMLNLGWTAWGDIGMAQRGSVRQVLQAYGVELLPASVGLPLGAALIDSDLVGDVVVAGKLGAFERGETPSQAPGRRQRPHVGPWPKLFDQAEAQADGTHLLQRTFDPHTDVGLDHHRIDGVPVLPGVVGVEMMVQAARYVLGAAVTQLHDVRFMSPVKLFRDAPLTVGVEVRIVGSTVGLTLVSAFVSPRGQKLRREHFTGVASTAEAGALLTQACPDDLELARDPGLASTDVYQRYFHGPAFQVLNQVTIFGENGGDALVQTERPGWLDGLNHDDFVTMPYAREAGFQIAGLWEMVEMGRMALPAGIDVLQLGPVQSATVPHKVCARRRLSQSEAAVFDIWTCDAEGQVLDVMLGYRTHVWRELTQKERFEPFAHTLWPKQRRPTSLVLPLDKVAPLLSDSASAGLAHYLTAAEMARLASFTLPKRRLEWLGGRLAAKRLIRETLFGRSGATVPYNAITIDRDELGAPVVHVIGDDQPAPRISLSHSDNLAVAFLSPRHDVRCGVDVERVETRDPSFATTYFSAREQDHAARAADTAYALTEMWAVKEAVLKALGLGARIDFRDLEVLFGPRGWQVILHRAAEKRAQELKVGACQVEVERHKTRVIARVLLPADGTVLPANVFATSLEARV